MAFLLSDENIVSYLVGIGVWPEGQLYEALKPQSGKNFNRRVSREGRDLLVKQEPHGPNEQAIGELAREWAFYQLLSEVPSLTDLRLSFAGDSPLSAALPLHFDAANAILVFPYLQDVIDLSAFYRRFEPPYPTAIASSIGETFAGLHRHTFQSQPCKLFWTSMYESAGLSAPDEVPDFLLGLRRLTPETFGVISADALKFFRFYQRYPEMGEAISQLNDAFTPCCVVHDDPRFANFLLREAGRFNVDKAVGFNGWSDEGGWLDEEGGDRATVQLIDWEKWKWGDPAYDLGKTIANYLRLWLESLPISGNLDLSTALNMAAVPLADIQGSTSAVVQSYLTHFPHILVHQPDFIVRLTQFTGLGLLRQVQLWIAHKSPIGNIEMAMTQVAKSLLCDPQAAISTVFGMSQAQIESAASSADESIPMQEAG